MQLLTKRLLAFSLLLSCSGLTRAQVNHAKWSNMEASSYNNRLEHEAVFVANKRASALKCRETYKEAKIVSEDWEAERNCHGNIIGRLLHMELYGETHDGDCGVAHFVFRQKLRGDDTFSPKLKISDMGSFYDLECE